MSTLTRFTVFVLIFALAACSAASPLEQNRQKWQDAAISHYRFELSIGCFCAFRGQMPLTIEVKDGQVVSMTDNQGNPVSGDFDETFNQAATVDRLFDLAANAARDADEVTVEYDPDYGYPVSIAIDNIKEAVDDEMAYQVAAFEVLE